MTTIGLIAMSARPYHAGHDALVRLAAKECDVVHLYASLSDRFRPGEVPILGADMKRLWDRVIEPSLPSNVEVTYGGSPVGNVYKEIGDANERGSDDGFVVYGDPDDLKTSYSRLASYVGNRIGADQVRLRAVPRDTTVDVSGTEMRGYLASNDKQAFLNGLPPDIDGDQVWSVLRATVEHPPAGLKRTQKAKKAPDPKVEGLLRRYVNECVRPRRRPR